jgi:hypothetical protein
VTAMHKDLLAQTPLLALPIAAMLIFLAVFIAVVVHTLVRGKRSYDGVARIPVDEGDA